MEIESMSRIFLILIAILLVTSATLAGAPRAVEELTEAHTRIVWCRHEREAGNDTFARSNRLRLLGFDSRDGLGERAILPHMANYTKPLLTHDGARIVFSNRHSRDVYVVDWDGVNRRKICDGVALAVWLDPASGTEWVFIGGGYEETTGPGPVFHEVTRVQLDDPFVSEPVWSRTPVSPDNFQLSADGSRAAAQFPWPLCGMAELPDGAMKQYGRGCWTSIAPDNSRVMWIFDGAHRNIHLCDTTSLRSWKVNINDAPGIDGYEVYHPRWSNHARFIVMTGPYKEGQGSNLIAGGGAEVEVYIGRFSDDFRQIEKWARVTENERGDFFPDAWIEGGDKSEVRLPAAQDNGKKNLRAEWPSHQEGLAFLWENGLSQNEIRLPGEKNPRICSVAPRGRARFGRYFEMDVKNGSFVAEGMNDAILQACKASGELTIEALVTSDSLNQRGPARIISFSTDEGSRNFTLGQEGGSLVFRLRTPQTGGNALPQVVLGTISAGVPAHVVVSYRPGELACYVDGERVFVPPLIDGDFSNWTLHSLVFGDELNLARNWSGRIGNIAIYSRFMNGEEAAGNQSRITGALADRTPAKRTIVKARLMERTPHPALEAIAPYRSALVTYVYEVEEVVSGDLSAPKIAIAHWALLNGETLELPQNKEGETYQLVIEDFDDHPQLQGERLVMDHDDFTLPLFYDVGLE